MNTVKAKGVFVPHTEVGHVGVCFCLLSSHVWLRRHAVPPQWDRKHNYCPAAPGPRQRGTRQVRTSSQMCVLWIPNMTYMKVPLHPVSSTYQVVVEEEMVKKVKRELGLQECFPLPMSHGEAQARGTPHYYTAELPPSSLPEASPFTVGDNHTYNGYWNSPLDPRKSYLVYFQAMSNFRGVSAC